MSYRPARLHGLTGRYDNPMPELTLSSSQESMNSTTVSASWKIVHWIQLPSYRKTGSSFPLNIHKIKLMKLPLWIHCLFNGLIIFVKSFQQNCRKNVHSLPQCLLYLICKKKFLLVTIIFKSQTTLQHILSSLTRYFCPRRVFDVTEIHQ